ncbi:peroxiredoxin [Rickettsiales bacterium]|nr:peroxiredoxin [Rickettsiales bacterium]
MIGVKDNFPAFDLNSNIKSGTPDEAFTRITNNTYKGKWLVFFAWPKDFTFVCPTEIIAFGNHDEKFKKLNAQVLGCSFDSEFVHLAWRNDSKHIGDIPFPFLSDIKRELCGQLGIIDADEGVPQRATIIVNPEGVVEFVYTTNLSIGRSPEEVLRVLEALQSGGLCAANWKSGDKHL